VVGSDSTKVYETKTGLDQVDGTVTYDGTEIHELAGTETIAVEGTTKTWLDETDLGTHEL
jgi:hypothetical protein